MKTSLDCIPCFVRQALEAAKLVSSNVATHEKILRQVLRWSCDIDMNQPPPVMGQRIHRFLREIVNIKDPYHDVKARQNRMAMNLLPEMKSKVEASSNPLLAAVRLAIAGNAIDLGANSHVTESTLLKSIRQALTTPFIGDKNAFLKAVTDAKRILYLADNAGEIVFDRLLIEKLEPRRVVVAVRGAPIINDATITDAHTVGLHEIVQVIDNGSDAPGTLLNDCSEDFKQHFLEADLILAKGQGNFETLSNEPYPIIFLFQAKCPVIATHAHVPIGTLVVTQSRYKRPPYGEES